MDYKRFYPSTIRQALGHEAPGLWMPHIPPGCIRLSAGYPAPELIPSDSFGTAVTSLLQAEQDLPLQYLGSPSMMQLHNHLLQRFGERNLLSQDDGLIVTSGAAQAIDLVARVILESGAAIAVESPTYMEALEIFHNYTDDIVEIPMDEFGLQLDVFESQLNQRLRAGLTLPRLLYTIPSFHNPTGVTLTLERRKQLLRLADKFDFLILEDDAYGELYFDEAPQTLKSLDKTGRVIYVGSMSKVIAPGLRIGWVVAPEDLISALGWFKKDLDHPFAQASVAVYLKGVDWEQRVRRLRDSYRERRDVMLQALTDFMPAHVTWIKPTGGYFVWIRVAGVDTSLILPNALQTGVSYIPGKHFFHTENKGAEFLRLSYSYVEPTLIQVGVRKLATLLS